jgi:hypothetical protein
MRHTVVDDKNIVTGLDSAQPPENSMGGINGQGTYDKIWRKNWQRKKD